jgi:type VI secretion system secreted protein VgrG
LRRIELEPAMSARPVRYRATLVPKLARASLAYGSRTFQELSAPEIVTRVLDEHGIDYELRLEETYPAREYTVQYEESDLAFVSRLLEHWGIFYYFESVAGGERMILGDSSHAFRPLEDHAELPYVMQVEEAGWSETGGVSMLGRVHEVQSERVVVRDYNWRHPRVVPEGEAAADAQSGYGVVRGYGEHVKDPTEAAHIAAVRAEERLAARELYEGRVSVPRLLPGHCFSLGDAPLGDLDQDYAVIEIEHSLGADASGFDGAGHLQKRFTAIPLEVR